VLGVEALWAARAQAASRSAERVVPADVLRAAVARLAPELRARLAQLPGAVLDPGDAAGRSEGEPLTDTGPLFRRFSPGALRALGAAGRAAATLGRSAIGPAHLVLGALEVDPELRERTALAPGRVRMVCSGLDEDSTPLPEAQLDGDERLRALLAELPDGAETLEVLGWILERGSQEALALLRRQKVTFALVERCRGGYQDPPPPGGPG
jgi:hypothetical protein